MKTHPIIRILSLTLALLLLGGLCLALPACGEDAPEREMVMYHGNSTCFLYRDLCFYYGQTGEKNEVGEDFVTLKYISMLSSDTVGAPVYGNVFAESGDPFQKSINSGYIDVLVDEEATEENDGVPVLFALLPLPQETEEEDIRYRAVSYNMATGNMKVLCENIGCTPNSFGLYGENLYYTQFVGEIDPQSLEITTEEYALFSLSKKGGEPEKCPVSISDSTFKLLGSYEGKMYLQTYETNLLYRYDPWKKETEKIGKLQSGSEPILGNDGYFYYRGAPKTVQKEGYSDLKVYNFYRQPLDGLKDLTEENGELLLEGIINSPYYNNGKIYYYSTADGHPFVSEAVVIQTDFSVLRSYDPKTKEKGVVFDFSDQQGIFWDLLEVKDRYFVIKSFTEEFVPYWSNSIVDRETMERKALDDSI